MHMKSFQNWLLNIKGFNKNTINSRVSTAKRIEKYYGSLTGNYNKDKLQFIDGELNTESHKIPIEGDYKTGTATLLSTLKLYLEFRDNHILDRIMNAEDLDPDSHDGSYELITETV